MAKDYLRQETLDPGKRLGRFAGFGAGAGLLAAVAAFPLAIAGNRLLIDVLPGDPSHRMWSGLGYVISSLVLFLIAAVVVRGVTR